ncbi:MAG: ABC transporter ATP-binding protein [Clostridia bacterium]|nr:ABC transporter ATP-binding protein [Clostridia bacterium]MBR2908520.1 ABC transporter ATP-binding protein [Clostridia bacterium]
MICAENVTLSFRTADMKKPFVALNGLSCEIPSGCIYGLVGSNGAGKSTFLRLISGVYRPDSGEITVDGLPVYENPEAKSKIFYVPDDLYFLPQSSMTEMARFYKAIYPKFSYERFHHLAETFHLDTRANMNAFSKGMRRQAATILGLSTMPQYLFFDETFDGLDPVMRNLVKQVIYSDVLERETTTIITSHSLRELEDTCDQLALLHKGGIVFESDIQNLKTSLFKVQTAFSEPFTKEKFAGIEILSYQQMGSVCSLIVRGDRDETAARIRAMDPLLLDLLPLNLEEVFIYEMEALGYAFKDVLM